MDCYNFSKGSFYFNLFQDFNKFFREMYTSEDSNALFSQYSEKFIQFYPGDLPEISQFFHIRENAIEIFFGIPYITEIHP